MRGAWARSSGRWAAAAGVKAKLGALASASAAAGLSFGAGGGLLLEERRQKNAILGGSGAKHRVAITGWSLTARSQEGLDETAKSFKGNFFALCKHLKRMGYEGMEITTGDLRRAGYFPDNVGDDQVVASVLAACEQSGMEVIGSLLHVTDGGPPMGASGIYQLDFNNPDFWEQLRRVISLEKIIGSEYVTFQIDLPEDKKSTGGAYRTDEDYLKTCAERIHRMQQICFEQGVNFYVETHVDRISEDPEAFCKIFDYCPSYFEVNADISHYLYRNISRGPHFDRILERVGHTHTRMARKHGDLSSDVGVHFNKIGKVGDPYQDWEEQGVTWQALEAMRPALLKGLSSRAVVGESGPAFSVKDALDLDARLLPLYRTMAALADSRAPAVVANPWR